MSEARTIVIAFVADENLRLVLEPPKGRGMDDPVTVALERGSGRAFGLGIKSPACVLWIASERCPWLIPETQSFQQDIHLIRQNQSIYAWKSYRDHTCVLNANRQIHGCANSHD